MTPSKQALPAGLAVLLGVATLCPPEPAQAQAPGDLAIVNVHVVDVRQGSMLEDRTVFVTEGRIGWVEPADRATLPPEVSIVDGTGAFLIPGLLDMHAHLRGNGIPPWVTTDWMMPLILAHGVTGVREMSSDCDGEVQGPVCLEQMKAWQGQIDEGELLGPRILALSSFLINPPWDYELGEEEARAFVRAMHALGIPNLKTYTRLSPEALRWIADEATTLELGVWGHVPLRATVREASNAGLRSIEHARDFLFECFPGSAEFRLTAMSIAPGVDVMRRMVDEHDPAVCAQIFQVLVENGTWYVPTHVTRRRDAFAGDSIFRQDPRMRYLFAELRDDFLKHMDEVAAADSVADGSTFRDFYLKGLEITGSAHRAGVGIMVGSDAPDPYVFLGSAIHDELAELVAAGLRPADALRAGTWNGARFLGLDEEYGSVEAGKRADLVLLEGNPLDDIQNVRRIRAVVLDGRHLDRDALDRLLQDAEVSATRPLAPTE